MHRVFLVYSSVVFNVLKFFLFVLFLFNRISIFQIKFSENSWKLNRNLNLKYLQISYVRVKFSFCFLDCSDLT